MPSSKVVVRPAWFAYASLLAAPALASPAIEVVASPDAPVAAERAGEIRATLASHLADSRSRAVRVLLTGAAAELSVDAKARTLPVDDWHDDAVVWLIAVHVMDLATPEPVLRVPPPPPLEAAAPRRATVVSLELGPRLGHGFDATDPTTVDLQLGADLRAGALRLGVAVGWKHGLTHAPDSPEEASFDAWPVRLRLGWASGRVELLASGFVAPYRLSALSPHDGVTWGAGGEVRWNGGREDGDGLGWFAGAGVELYARRATYQVTEIVYSTPRVAPYVTVGLSYGFIP